MLKIELFKKIIHESPLDKLYQSRFIGRDFYSEGL